MAENNCIGCVCVGGWGGLERGTLVGCNRKVPERSWSIQYEIGELPTLKHVQRCIFFYDSCSELGLKHRRLEPLGGVLRNS